MAISAIQSSELIQYSSTGKQPTPALGQEGGHVELKQSSYTTEISGYGQIRAALDRLESAAADLSGPTAFSLQVAASSKPEVVTAELSNDQVSGAYDVEVQQLARAQTVLTSSQASANNPLGSGEKTTLSFAYGETSDATFTPDAARAVETVSLDARHNTLNGFAAAVNAADIGVSAAVISDGHSFQLQITGKASGAENSFSITASGDERLEKELSFTTDNEAQEARLAVAAQDAKLKVNSITLEADTNTVAEAVPGATLKLKSVGSAKITTEDNPENVVAQKVVNFLTAVNDLQAQLKQSSAGEVSVPPVVRQLKSRVNEVLEDANRHAGALGGLAGIGIQADAKGNLQLDTSKFQTALSTNREAVTEIFTDEGTGFADLFAVVAQDLAKVASHEVSRLSEASRTDRARQSGSASGISLETSGLDTQYSQLSGLVKSVEKTDQTLNGLLLQGDAAQSSQSSHLNRLNSLANLATP